MLKRGIDGTYHVASRKHLFRYLAVFESRRNTRWFDDGDRTLQAA
jgi:hypothetical protein